MSSKVLVGVLQLNSSPNKEANFEQASMLVKKAKQGGARVSFFFIYGSFEQDKNINWFDSLTY